MARTGLRGSQKSASRPTSKTARPKRPTVQPPGRIGTQGSTSRVEPKETGTLPRGPKGAPRSNQATIDRTAKVQPATGGRLPPCPGPKLNQFKYHQSRIKWLEQLDANRDGESGVQGCVFRVEIRSREYALKVFKDFDPESIRFYWEAYLGPDVSAETAAYYTDPFYCECRAYGRIQEALDSGEIKVNPAVECYGFMHLKLDDEKEIEKYGLDLRDKDSEPGLQIGTGRYQPLRAIVKKLAPSTSGVTIRRQGKILKNIQMLNDLKIYNRDVRTENLRGGLFVDFGSSLTEPHIIFDSFDSDEKGETYLEDRGMLEDMLKDEGIRITIDIFPATGAGRILRPRV